MAVRFAALTWLPARLDRRVSPRARLGLTFVRLAAYAGALPLLVNAAHLGGLLVHADGIRAEI